MFLVLFYGISFPLGWLVWLYLHRTRLTWTILQAIEPEDEKAAVNLKIAA